MAPLLLHGELAAWRRVPGASGSNSAADAGSGRAAHGAGEAAVQAWRSPNLERAGKGLVRHSKALGGLQEPHPFPALGHRISIAPRNPQFEITDLLKRISW